MAQKRKKPSKPKLPKMTMADISNLSVDQLNKATKAELTHYVKTLSRIANKRIEIIESKGLADISPAYLSLMQGGELGRGKFSVGNKTKNKLRTELKRAQLFLGNQTSTIKGTRKYISRSNRHFGGKNITQDLRARMGRVFNAWKRNNVGTYNALTAGNQFASQQFWEMARELVLKNPEQENIDFLVTIMEDKVEEYYDSFTEEEDIFDRLFGDR